MPYVSCLPLGILASALFLLGLVLGAVWHIGVSASTSDEEDAYNNAVAEWTGLGRSFREGEFDICEEGGRCIPLNTIVNGDDEGVPPTYQLHRYTATFFETDAESPSSLLFNQIFDPRATVSIYLRSRTEHNRRSRSLRVHLYKWHWQPPLSCNTLMGESRLGPDCIQISVLERICITVNETSPGQWDFAARYGADPGCLVSPAASWDPGAYSFVNSSEIVQGMNQTFIGHRQPTNRSVLLPYRLPTSDWMSDFMNVKVRIRSIYDPILTLENITNGTLSLDDVRIRSPLSSFATYAMLIISIICIAVAISIVLCLTVCFPKHRRFFLFQFYSEVPSPHNKLRSLSQIYM